MAFKLATSITVALLLALHSAANAEGVVEALTSAPVPDGEATLTVWSFLPDNYEAGAEAYADVVAGFQAKYPNIKVELADIPYTTYFDNVRNAILAQNGPDVVTMYGAAQAYSYKNGLFPLQDVLTPEITDTLLFLNENTSSDGNLYILPTGTYGYALMANKDLFAAADVDPIGAMQSWGGMLDACKALTAAGVQPIASGWRDGYFLETLVYMISSQLLDDAALKRFVARDLQMDDKVFADTVSRILEMRDAGCFGGDDALGRNMYDDTTNQYLAGQAAMLVVGTINTATYVAASQPNSVVLALPMVPDAPNGPMIDAGAEAGWAVTRWTEHPEAALAFVTYMASAEVQNMLAATIDVPANIKGATSPATDPLHSDYLALLALPDNHTGFAAIPLTVLAVIERNAVPLMSGAMSAEDFVQGMQSAFLRTR